MHKLFLLVMIGFMGTQNSNASDRPGGVMHAISRYPIVVSTVVDVVGCGASWYTKKPAVGSKIVDVTFACLALGATEYAMQAYCLGMPDESLHAAVAAGCYLLSREVYIRCQQQQERRLRAQHARAV